jgi:hypothetical protein
LDHVPHCYSAEDGQVVQDILLERLSTDDLVTVSFDGVTSVPSSFVNTALISLLGKFSFEEIRRRVRFADTNTQINEMIKKRFVFETTHRV